jgi:hypothetical protein
MLAIALLFHTQSASEMFIVITYICLNYSVYFFSDTFWLIKIFFYFSSLNIQVRKGEPSHFRKHLILGL